MTKVVGWRDEQATTYSLTDIAALKSVQQSSTDSATAGGMG
jgi:hypothetical protein